MPRIEQLQNYKHQFDVAIGIMSSNNNFQDNITMMSNSMSMCCIEYIVNMICRTGTKVITQHAKTISVKYEQYTLL